MVSEFVAYQNDLIQIMCAQFTCTNCAHKFVYKKKKHLIKSFVGYKLENQEELNHTTPLQTPILCIDVYKSRNKVDSSL